MSLAAFADSLGYESHPSPDPKAGTAIVKLVLPRPSLLQRLQGLSPEKTKDTMVSALRTEFERWCRENGGKSGLAPEFKDAADEYGAQFLEQHQRRPLNRTEPVVCRTPNQSMLAGYFYFNSAEPNPYDGQAAFYDAPSAQAFVNAFGPMAEARKKKDAARVEAYFAKLNADAAERKKAEAAEREAEAAKLRAEEAAYKSADPHPELEAWRIQLATELSQVLRRNSIAGFKYLGYCRIEFTKDRQPITFSLQGLNHMLLTNVQVIETPATGAVCHVTIADKTGVEAGRISVLGLGTAQQLVVSLEQLGQSCGAW